MQRNKLNLMLSAAIALSGLLLWAKMSPGFAAADQRKTMAEAGPVEAGFTTVTSARLASMLRNKDFYFVNVHIPYEGEIKRTDRFIPFDKIAQNLGELPKNKNAKIVLYCRTGRMSATAARELARLGYRRVSHLAGGMIDWERSGYELVRK